MTPGAPQDWVTLLELDRAAGLPKGSAFRAFKSQAGGFAEERDYRVLRPEEARDAIDALRAADRIYPGSVNVVLLSPEAARRIAGMLK